MKVSFENRIPAGRVIGWNCPYKPDGTTMLRWGKVESHNPTTWGDYMMYVTDLHTGELYNVNIVDVHLVMPESYQV